ncbi:MAG: hypothetical protein KI790_04840 [Cyclobacteriaceae bacterium]|nr:hypothetical protein [Cyclobacteriaceae bacterium HetDA_MAG_MS6]
MFASGTEDSTQQRWEESWSAGVGREMRMTRWLSITAIVLYDFNHKNNQLQSRPVSFRLGYQITPFPGKKQKRSKKNS